MRRSMEPSLVEWARGGTKPLLLLGPRQVGKTWLMQNLGRAAFPSANYFNFEDTPGLASAFGATLDPLDVVRQLAILSGQRIEPGALLIFDEIQSGGRALTSLKYFRERSPETRVVAAGSLLGVDLSPEVTFPVGQVDEMRVFPMTFTEYLWALDRYAWVDALDNWMPGDKAAPLPHDRLLDAFREYLVVGGMPAAVSRWVSEPNLHNVRTEQQAILSAYSRDISKHAPSAWVSKIWEIWDSIPSHLARETTQQFRWSDVAPTARSDRYRDALYWLLHSGIAARVKLSEHPSNPLAVTSDPARFKLYLSDVGLLGALANAPLATIDQSPRLRGALAENAVLQSLYAQGRTDVHYWSSGNTAEVDFVSALGRSVVPMEVKSGGSVRSYSLSEYRKRYEPQLAVRLSTREPGLVDGLLSLPLYMADQLVRLTSELEG